MIKTGLVWRRKVFSGVEDSALLMAGSGMEDLAGSGLEGSVVAGSGMEDSGMEDLAGSGLE